MKPRDISAYTNQTLPSFIEQEIYKQLFEELEGMRRNLQGDFGSDSHVRYSGYNEAIEDVKNLIKKRG